MPRIFGIEFNPFKKLRKVQPAPAEIAAPLVTSPAKITPEEEFAIINAGFSMNNLSELIAKESIVNYERYALYREIDRAYLYPLMSAAVELYADVATTYSSIQNATVWVSGEKRYVNEISRLFDRLSLEEKIFDWTHTVGTYGDFILRIRAQPGAGVLFVEDDDHPINISRLDYNGRLVGFYDSPLGGTAAPIKMQPPWDFVHYRLLGAKRKRPIYADPMYTEFRTVSMIDPETRRITGKYGMSLLTNALPIYKRLRLSEDSLMMARLSKGPLHYLFKLRVEGDNAVRIKGLVEQYKTMLKRQKSLNLASGDPTGSSPNYEDQYGAIPVAEDIFLPVWGDAKNDLTMDRLGGEPDIRWITDIDLLRNQLACALRVPLQLLGGFTDEMPSSLGRSALERMDIRFARSARRLQRSMINGLTRLAQIHLAHIGLNPNVNFFQINMPETSSAEEEELKDALDKGVDVVDKMFDMTIKFVGEDFDKLAFLEYLNEKILKLNDLDLQQFSRKLAGSKLPPEAAEVAKEAIHNALKRQMRPVNELRDSDLRAMLPMNESLWKARYGKWKFQVQDGNGRRLDTPEEEKK